MANRRKRLGKKLNGVYSYLWRKLFNPNSFIVTLLIFVFLWVFHLVQVNMHFLDPFNYGIRDYQITDIIYSQFRDPGQIRLIDEVVLVNSDLMPRDSLPLLLRRLRQLGPKVIGLDILLEDQGDDEVIDSLLREEIRQTPNLVLAGALGPYIDSLQRFPRWRVVTRISGRQPRIWAISTSCRKTPVRSGYFLLRKKRQMGWCVRSP